MLFVFAMQFQSLSLGLAWLSLVWVQFWGGGESSYFNRCFCGADRPLGLGLGFPHANRSGLIVCTWALINAKKMMKVASRMLASSHETLNRSLKISSGVLAAFEADRLVLSHLKARRDRCGYITLVHRVLLIIITGKVYPEMLLSKPNEWEN